MPPRKTTTKKTKTKLATSARNDETTQEICDGCLVTIPNDELLSCSICGVKLHRYCAGIPRSHYARVAASFVCIVCSQIASDSLQAELRQEIASLKVQVSELKEALAETTNSIGTMTGDIAKLKKPPLVTRSSGGRTYAAAVVTNSRSRNNTGRSGQSRETGVANAKTSSNQRQVQFSASGSDQPGRTVESGGEGSKHRTKVQVKGAHKIWGTMAETTVRSVKNVITRFCNCTPRGLYVKRKDRVVAATNKSVWWYIVHADEEVLCDLETKWESIQLQLKWKLEHCFMFKETTDPRPSPASDDDSQPALAPQAQSVLLNTDSIQTPMEDDGQLPTNEENQQVGSQVHDTESQNMDALSSTSSQNTETVTVAENHFLVKEVVSPVHLKKLT